MALANIACLLAQNLSKGEQVLMVDWDLEAPGLDAYFPERRRPLLGKGNQEARDGGPEGLIDIFWQMQEALSKLETSLPTTVNALDVEAALASEAQRPTSHISRADLEGLLDKLKPERFAIDTKVPNLKLLRAGRLDSNYPTKVNTFDWENLYNRAPLLFRVFSERLAVNYRYVLIDSRTGLTDISGICTMLMPQKLVVVFTPNRQSLTGIRDVVTRAANYRRESPDVRPLAVFPLPSRIETDQPRLMHRWRSGDPEFEVEGYQPIFEDLFRKVYDLERCDLEEYFNEVKIQQVEDYAYGEQIAVLEERRSSMDRFSLARSYQTFAERLLNLSGPWMKVDDQGDQILALPHFSESYVMMLLNVLRRILPRVFSAGMVAVAVMSVFLAWSASERVQKSDVLRQLEISRLKSKEEENRIIAQQARSVAQQAITETETVDRVEPDYKRPEGAGYIWLGTWEGTHWESVNLADPETKRAITIAPDKIERGVIYRLRANMVLRDGLPEEGGESVRVKRRVLGIIPEEDEVVVEEPPKKASRFGRAQYWVLIRSQPSLPSPLPSAQQSPSQPQ
jgi:hypothetical protein